MGMYTGIRCRVIIKPEYREELDYLHNDIGYEWAESNLEFMREYGKFYRAVFIPCGSLSYMPEEWEDTDEFSTAFNLETGLWTFQCSLKNYENEIESFFENVLSNITEEVIHLEYFYEEWSRSKFYELDDGKIVLSNKDGIKYAYDSEDQW